MTTTLERPDSRCRADRPERHPGHREDFEVVESDVGLGRNIPQTAGRALWLPMFVMAIMAFPIGLGLSIWRASLIADGSSPDTVAALGQFVPAVMFFGFLAVFSAIAFAIARILGEFRKGGGEVQELASHGGVQTLAMPGTAKAFIGVMAMGMMVLMAAIVGHVAAGIALAGGSTYAAANQAEWSLWLGAGHRFGVSLYLFSILLGLATIVSVLRFQAVRIREVAAA